MMKEMTLADKLQRTFNNLPQVKKDRINRILENYEGTAFATPHEPSDEEKLVHEITILREQVEKLKAELASIDGALNDPRANLTLTTSEIIWELKDQLAALAEQNEKMRSAVRWIQDRCAGDAMPRWEPGMRTTHSRGLILDRTNYVLDLPDLATPVLNRIRAEGMRMAADFVELPIGRKLASLNDGNRQLADAIRDRADELEKNNG